MVETQAEVGVSETTWSGAAECADLNGGNCDPVAACTDRLVVWVNGLGGEARYGEICDRDTAEWVMRIVITGPDGDLVMLPGDTAVDAGEWFPDWKHWRSIKRFTVRRAGESR